MLAMKGIDDFVNTPEWVLNHIAQDIKSIKLPERMDLWHRDDEIRKTRNKSITKDSMTSMAEKWVENQKQKQQVAAKYFETEISRFKDMAQTKYKDDKSLKDIDWEAFKAKESYRRSTCSAPSSGFLRY